MEYQIQLLRCASPEVWHPRQRQRSETPLRKASGSYEAEQIRLCARNIRGFPCRVHLATIHSALGAVVGRDLLCHARVNAHSDPQPTKHRKLCSLVACVGILALEGPQLHSLISSEVLPFAKPSWDGTFDSSCRDVTTRV